MKVWDHNYAVGGGDSDYAVRVDVEMSNLGDTTSDLMAYAKAEFDDGLTFAKKYGKILELYFVDEDYANFAHDHLVNKWLPASQKRSEDALDVRKVQGKLAGKRVAIDLRDVAVLGQFHEMTGRKYV